MVVSEIKLYEILKIKFGEREAEFVVEGIKQEVKTEFENHKNLFATKEDLANTKVELIKWMVGLVIASLIAQVSIMIALIKLVH